MSTTQLAPCLLHARFEGARLVWSLRRGETEIGAGKISPLAADPLRELRRLELRAGANVRLTNANLTPDELAYAHECGWANK